MMEDVLEGHYDIRDSDQYKLRVEESALPRAGLGLFASREMSKGEYICEYYGSVTTAKHSENAVFNDEDKMVQLDEEYCIISRAIASRANDIIAFNPADYLTNRFNEDLTNKQFPLLSGKNHNARLSTESKQKVFIKAKRDIRAG